MPKLDINQVRKLESPITEGEIRQAVSLMNTGKSPGNDGIPAEYYKEYIDVLAPMLVKVYQEAFEKSHVPPTFNEFLLFQKKIETQQTQQILDQSACLTWIVEVKIEEEEEEDYVEDM